MSNYHSLHKVFVFFTLFVFASTLTAQTISLSTGAKVISVGEVFQLTLYAEGSFESIVEPDFKNFNVENRSESQSSSISIINGKFESKKSINYTYLLRGEEPGVFKIGPASVKLKNGKKNDSNVITVTVTGSASQKLQESEKLEEKAEPVPTANSLMAPLTNWEKRTPNYFLRAVVSPQGDVYEGEPVVVKYYVFTKPGSISDLNFYKVPSFENCWKEEKGESRLTFKRLAVEKNLYDYGLLRTYYLLPEKGLSEISGTQMIVDVVTGSFFNTGKQSISTPALNIPLIPLPEKDLHKNGFYADISLSVDQKSVTLDSNNLLSVVTYTISGCGNLQRATIELVPEPGLKYFSPEIELNADGTEKGYCGDKKYRFMVKGINKGKYSVKAKELEVFSREKGWQILQVPEVEIDVKDVAISIDYAKEERAKAFELLKEFPAEIKKHSTVPVTKRGWFKVVLAVPFLMVLVSVFMWSLGSLRKKQIKSRRAKIEKWKRKIKNTNSLNELLNAFYDALKEIYSVELRGERKQNVAKKYGDSVEDVIDFIKEIEFASFSGEKETNLADFKSKAETFLDLRGIKK
ncbi:MAG: BatD family protein [bacterium]